MGCLVGPFQEGITRALVSVFASRSYMISNAFVNPFCHLFFLFPHSTKSSNSRSLDSDEKLWFSFVSSHFALLWGL